MTLLNVAILLHHWT